MALAVPRKAKPVRTDNDTGVDGHAIAKLAPFAYHHIGIDHTIAPDRDLAAYPDAE